jgi:hypothetical protein
MYITEVKISVESNSHGCGDNVLLLLSCRKNLIPFHCVRCWLHLRVIYLTVLFTVTLNILKKFRLNHEQLLTYLLTYLLHGAQSFLRS